ncbi:MAG: hypothetical protein GY950_26575 [bacterium]|nr:hypothetical protein [bacterium]
MFVLLTVFQLGSYFSHRKAFFRVTGEAALSWDPASLKPGKGSHGVWQIEEEGYSQRLYNHLGEGGHFLYLCHPDRLPGDISAGDFLQLSAALLGVSPSGSSSLGERLLGELSRIERFRVLLEVVELAERGGIGHFLFYNLTDGMSIDGVVRLKVRIGELLSGGKWVMLLVWEQVVSNSETDKSFGIREAKTWAEQVDAIKGILDKK